MKVTVERLECTRCGHKWWPRITDDGTIIMPKNCPNKKCKSPYWSKPRQKDQIKQDLIDTARNVARSAKPTPRQIDASKA